jgi:dTDP-4-dehydrorhamnose reductase
LSQVRAYALKQQKKPGDKLDPRLERMLDEVQKLIDQYLSPTSVQEVAAALEELKKQKPATDKAK